MSINAQLRNGYGQREPCLSLLNPPYRLTSQNKERENDWWNLRELQRLFSVFAVNSTVLLVEMSGSGATPPKRPKITEFFAVKMKGTADPIVS